MDGFEQGMWASRERLKSFAMKLYRNQDDADDAVQSTFCLGLAGREGFTYGTDPTSWLLKIMYRAFASRCRSAETRRMTYPGKLNYADCLRSSDDPHRTLELKEALEALDEVTERCPRFGAAVAAVCFELTGDEMAEQFGIKPSSTRSLVAEGRKRVRKLMGEAA